MPLRPFPAMTIEEATAILTKLKEESVSCPGSGQPCIGPSLTGYNIGECKVCGKEVAVEGFKRITMQHWLMRDDVSKESVSKWLGPT